MANSPVVGTGPIQFTDAGQQLSIPLTDLAFDSSGNIVNSWPLYSHHATAADAWINYLVKNGAIYPGAAPPPAAAMVLTAHQVGSSGNNISITFSNVGTADPTDTKKFDAVLTEKDSYPGLTKDTIVDALANRPGLVTIPTATPGKPANGQYQMPAAPFKVKVLQADGTTKAFDLQARDTADSEAKYTTVTISGVSADPNNPFFDLTITWQKTATAIDVNELKGVGATPGVFEYEVDITAPTGGSLAMPAAGTFNLRGGSETATAKSASAIVVGG
jgi:hypothetical protein